MSKDELATAAEEALMQHGPNAHLLLTVPGKWNMQEFKRLWGRSGPKGRIVGEPTPGRLVCDFVAEEVLADLRRRRSP